MIDRPRNIHGPYRKNQKNEKKRRMKPLNPLERKQVKTIIEGKAEKKFLAIAIPSVNFSSTPSLVKLNYDATLPSGIPVLGTGDTNRVGDDISWHSMYMRLMCHYHPSATQNGHYGRFIIFQWHQNDVSNPIIGNILLTGVAGSIDYSSQYAQDTRSLFTILYDRTFAFVSGGANEWQHVTQYIKIKRRKVRFVSGPAANNSTNSIYYIVIGDGSTGTETAQMFATFLLKYTDV